MMNLDYSPETITPSEADCSKKNPVKRQKHKLKINKRLSDTQKSGFCHISTLHVWQ